MPENHLREACARVSDSVLGRGLLDAFMRIADKNRLGITIRPEIVKLSAPVGVDEGLHAHLETASYNSRLMILGETFKVVVIETGAFGTNGERVNELNEEGEPVGFEHLISISHRSKGLNPWSAEAVVYDAVVGDVKEGARRELGEELAKKMTFYKD